LIEHLTFLTADFRAQKLAAEARRNLQNPAADQIDSAFDATPANEAFQRFQVIGASRRPAPANLMNTPATKPFNGTSRKTSGL
jgi:hypothetical protein